jgi:hypothetical protein
LAALLAQVRDLMLGVRKIVQNSALEAVKMPMFRVLSKATDRIKFK